MHSMSFVPRDTDSFLENSEKYALTWMDILRKLILSDDCVAARLSAATASMIALVPAHSALVHIVLGSLEYESFVD